MKAIAFICEDVRTEADGRHSFMGVFNVSHSLAARRVAKISFVFIVDSLEELDRGEDLLIELKLPEVDPQRILHNDEQLMDMKRKAQQSGGLTINIEIVFGGIAPSGSLSSDLYIRGEKIAGSTLILKDSPPPALIEIKNSPQVTAKPA